MGAWGHDTFDNDTACDWAYGLEGVNDLSLVMQAITSVLEAKDGYLDADIASEGLAACEVIARLKGNLGARNAYTEPVDNWVNAHPIPVTLALVEQARAAIDRVLSPPSELLELSEDGKEPQKWRDSVNNLRTRVTG